MIQKFNEYNDHELSYQKVSEQEYLKSKFLGKQVNIEDGYINYILNKLFYKLIDHKIVRYYFIPEKSLREFQLKKSLKLTYDSGDTFMEIDIYQLDDEYFLVDFNSLFNDVEEFYKCDQIYGLESLFKNKGII